MTRPFEKAGKISQQKGTLRRKTLRPGRMGLVSDTRGSVLKAKLAPGSTTCPSTCHGTPTCYPTVTMPWKIPAQPTKWYPRRKFMFPRPFLYKLHRVFGLSPRQISELHKEMLGLTILPHGVRTYLKAYGIFEPRTRGRGSKSQAEEYKEHPIFKKLVSSWEEQPG